MSYHCVDFICFSLLFRYFLFVDLSNDAVAVDVSPLETWELQEDVLSGNTRWAYSTWNGDSSYPDCIFTFGGEVCTECNTLFCYNITSNELEEFGTMDSDLSSTRRQISQHASFIISDGTDDYLYYVTYDGDVYYYDLNDPDESDVLKASIDVFWPCLLKHPNDNEFYVIDGYSGSTAGDFYVYDLEDNEIHQGNDMIVARYCPGCVVNDWDQDNPYIYVLGGQTGWMERININDARNNEWEKLQLILSSSLSDLSSVTIGSLWGSSIASYNNFIYLIGGYDGSREDDIFALDVENWEVSWAGLFPSGLSCAAASVAEGRVYMIGGYTSGDTDDVYISNSFDEVTDQDITEDDDAISPMETWKLNEAVLTGNTRWPYSAWNGDSSYPDCIFIFGGQVCTECNTLYCYNLTSNELETFGTMDSDLSSTRYQVSQDASFIISDGDDDYLYYATIDGDVYYYDLNNPDESDVLKTSVDITWPCLLKHPDNTEFYVIDGANGGEFYVYDLEDHEIHQGSDMIVARYCPGCVVNNWDQDNPYIYLLGGQTGWMERISIKNNDARNNEWEKLQLILSGDLSDMSSITIGSLWASSIISYNNFIYLIGGYDGSREDDIFAFDVENWKVYWAGLFPLGISCASASFAEDRVYMIGGYTSGDTDDIYISNSFSEVSALAASKSTSCDSEGEGVTPTEPVTTRPFGFDNKNNKEMVNIKQGDIISDNDNKNNNIINVNNLYDIISKVAIILNLFMGVYICKYAPPKWLSINYNKNNNGKYQYQSI